MILTKKYDNQYEKMTQEPVGRLVISLGIPTTISMLVTNIYNMVDTMFVGKLGTSASGAVGIVFGFMAILQAFGFMFGQGSGVIISRQLGQKDTENASKVASIGFFLAFFMGAFIGIAGYIFMNPILYLCGSTETILPFARDYILYILIAAPFTTSSFVLNNIIRYEGKATFAMVGLVTGAVLNIIGDPIFMFVLDMGIAGAGLSTAISQIVSFAILLSVFLMGKTESRISIKMFSFDLAEIWNIVTTGLPSLVRQGLGSVSTMLLNQHAGEYGDATVAAMSIVNRVSMFIFSAGLGIGQGFQPVCGFNYGAGKYRRVKQAFKVTVTISEVMMAVCAIIFFVFAEPVVTLFRDDIEVISFGVVAMRYQCVAMLAQPLAVVANMTLQASQNRLAATFMSMLRSGLYFIPVLTVATALFGKTGVLMAQPVADVLTFVTVIPFMIHFFVKLPKEND